MQMPSTAVIDNKCETDESPLTGEWYEVIDGRIVALPGMGAYHQIIVSGLALAMAVPVQLQRLGRVVVVMLFDFSSEIGRKRRPDIAFVSEQRWSRSRPIDESNGWDVCPNLSIEVTSLKNTWNEILNKTHEYFQVGVEQVWVINPSQLCIYDYHSPANMTIVKLDDSLVSETLIPGFCLPLTELFEVVGAGRRE